MTELEAIIAGISIIFGTSCAVGITWIIARTVLRMRQPAELESGAMARLEGRLERMEQALDAVAIEMERVSEGQRFTSRLLSERAEHGTPR
jgi:hypothetical protein